MHRLTIVTVLWVLTGWLGAMGLLLQALGVYYETTVPAADGLLMLIVGAAFLSLGGIFATVAAKIQQERKILAVFPKESKASG
jgi:hypothetical protein